MTTDDLTAFGKLADLMRAKGISECEWAGVRMKLGPPYEAPREASKPAVDDEMCSCGHPAYHHNGDAGCLKGCDAEKCNPPEVSA